MSEYTQQHKWVVPFTGDWQNTSHANLASVYGSSILPGKNNNKNKTHD